MRTLARAATILFVAVGALVAPGPGAAAAASSVGVAATTAVTLPACDNGFHAVASPNSTGGNYLNGISVIGATDIWAVGDSENAAQFDQTLAEHWNGNAWSVVSTPNFGGFDNDLNGVAAISSGDVWAVGDYAVDSAGTSLVGTALHWNGTAWTTFTFAPSPNATLFAVAAVSTSDIWAVGMYATSIGKATLVEHWNGGAWSQVTSPSPSTLDNELFAVSAWSATDVWAVGRQQASTAGAPLQALALHWNGTAWSTVTTPNTASSDNEMFGVATLEAGHAVGVGYGNYNQMSSIPRRSEGWDLLAGGSSTNNVAVGGGGLDAPNTDALQAVSRSGAGLWAVGYTRPDLTQTAPRHTIVVPATWNAASHTLAWGSVGTSDSPSGVNDVLLAVSAVSPYAFWAGGFQGSATRTLTEMYCAIHFGVSAPATVTAGSPFSVTVTAQDGAGATVSGYSGTVSLTSSDPGASLPASYTFAPGDAGSHTFTGMVLNTPGSRTVTAADSTMPLTSPGSSVVSVLCAPGVCPGPASTPGPRGAADQATAATGSSRVPTNQSSGVAGGPRLPPTKSRLGDVAGAVADPTAGAYGAVHAPASEVAAAPAAPHIDRASWGAGKATVNASTHEADPSDQLQAWHAGPAASLFAAAHSQIGRRTAGPVAGLLFVAALIAAVLLAAAHRRRPSGPMRETSDRA